MPEQKFEIGVSDSGALIFIYDDSLEFLKTLGNFSIKRASHVEPTEDGRWTAEMLDGTVLGPFDLRKDALEAEVEYLKEVLFQ